MTYRDWKELVREKTRVYAMSSWDRSSYDYGSKTSRDMWRYFQQFMEKSSERLVRGVPLTLAAGETTYSLADPTISPESLVYVGTLYSNGVEVSAYEPEALRRYFPSPIDAGTPRGWIIDENSILEFEREMDASGAAATWTADGFALHPPLDVGAEDATVLKISAPAEEASAEFVAVMGARSVASTPEELRQLQAYTAFAQSYIDRRAARQAFNLPMTERIRIR